MSSEPLRQSPTDIPYLSQKDITLADVMRKLDEIERKIAPLQQAVTGNGQPMEGLSVRVTLLERWKEESNRRATFHTIASILNLLILVVTLVWLVWNVR